LAFQVDITEPALVDAEDYVRFIRDVRKEPEAAERWFRGLVQAIYTLEELPERCPVIPEQDEFSDGGFRSLRIQAGKKAHRLKACATFSIQAWSGPGFVSGSFLGAISGSSG
jgi:hypothetical protein